MCGNMHDMCENVLSSSLQQGRRRKAISWSFEVLLAGKTWENLFQSLIIEESLAFLRQHIPTSWLKLIVCVLLSVMCSFKALSYASSFQTEDKVWKQSKVTSVGPNGSDFSFPDEVT